MLLSIAEILILGLSFAWICKKMNLPSLIGMILAGIILGPYCLNLLDKNILLISADIRQIALIIILARAGLSLDISGLKQIGRPAIMMSFIPASFELLGIVLLAPYFFKISILEAAIMGAVISAVSPAVVVPRMIKLIEEGYGTKKNIPQLILAGASVDDVYVIVLFTSFLNMLLGNKVSILSFINIPISIILGIIIGWIIGKLLALFFRKIHIRDNIKISIMLSIFFILIYIEGILSSNFITFSALIAIMFSGIALKKYKKEVSEKLAIKFNEIWIVAEVFLFVLVGACVNISYVWKFGIIAVLVIVVALIFRLAGVFVCLIGSDLNKKERLFTMLAYTPKATVQAAIGGVCLSLGLSCGDAVLTLAVLAIVITAPLGAFAIDNLYKKMLSKKND